MMLGLGLGLPFRRATPGAGVPAAIAPDFHDDFTDVADTELDAHVMTPAPVYAPPTWVRLYSASTRSLKINSSGVVVQGADAVGAFTSYVFPADSRPAIIHSSQKTTSPAGDGGILIRISDDYSAGLYITLRNEVAGNRIRVGFFNFATDAQIGSYAYITATQFYNAFATFVITDDGSTITIYVEGDESNSVSLATTDNADNANVGVIVLGLVSDFSMDDFKVWYPESFPELTAANYPAAVSIFPVTPTSVTNGTSHLDSSSEDVISGLTVPLAESSPVLDADWTVRYRSTGNEWFHLFNESYAAVKAALDGPSATAPIIMLVSCRWRGTSEAYGQSLGYGDWQMSTDDFLYVGARNQLPSVDLHAEMKSAAVTIAAVDADAYDQGVLDVAKAYWYSHLIIVDPTTSSITMKTISDLKDTVETNADTGVAFSQAFTFASADNGNITLHAAHKGFMALLYPATVPTDAEADQILRFHWRSHRDKKKRLHPWFEGVAKAT